MVSMAAILSVATAVAITVDHVQAHGYVEIPQSEFVDSETSEFIVQIDPQWTGDWEGADGDEGLVALYKELKASSNVPDIRTMLDSDTSLYGADCGYTDPNATPKDPPSDGTATLSRGMVHAGPCEIWLDDELVLTNDDCQSAYGDGSQELKSVFTPVDYSKCASGGCMFRFYWLALQRLDGETVWQVYKNCIPLSGPAGGGSSTSTTSTASSSIEGTSETPATESSAKQDTSSSATQETSEQSKDEETSEQSMDEETSEKSEGEGDDEKSEDKGDDEKSEDEGDDEKSEDEGDDENSEESKDDEKSEDEGDDENSEESKDDENSEESKDDENSEESKDDETKQETSEETEDYSDEVGGEADPVVADSPSVMPAAASKCARRTRN